MTRRLALSALVLVWIPLLAATSVADKPLPPSVEVEEGPFGDAVVMDGVLAPVGAVQIKIRLERYGGPLEVVEAVRAGPVEPGAVLARFDREPIDRELAGAALDLELVRTRFEQSEIELASKVAEARYALEEARRAHRMAKEKLERFEKSERQLRIDEAELNMAWGLDSLSNQKEELEQLEKMYKEDDLTEETEEIVLRRARRSFERSKRSYEFRKQRHKWFLEVDLPRDHEAHRLALRKREIKLDKAVKLLELETREADLERRKSKRAFAEKERKYKELQVDRERLVVRAPAAGGYALPGEFRDGAWRDLGEGGTRWEAGDRPRSGTVLYTVFEPTRLGVQATVDQKNLADVRPGLTCTVSSSVAPGTAFPAEIESVADYAEGTRYEVHVALEAGHAWFRAGQKVKATIMGASAPVGLHIPTSCVVGTGTKAHVLLLGEVGVEKRAVVLGERIGDRIGVREGLETGQRVVLNPPKLGLDRDGARPERTRRDEPGRTDTETGEERPTEREPDEGDSTTDEPEDAETESLVGTWRGRVLGPEPFPPEGFPALLVVTQAYDGDLEGVFGMMGDEAVLEKLTFDPETGKMEFATSDETGSVSGEGEVEGDELTGTWFTRSSQGPGLSGTFRFRRESE